MRLGRREEAIASFRTAFRIDARDTSPLLKAGFLELDLGLTDEAERTFRTALEHEAVCLAYVGLAQVLMNRGDVEAAGSLLRQAEDAPKLNGPALRAAHDRLREMKS